MLRIGSDQFMHEAMKALSPALVKPVEAENRTISRVYLGLSGKVIAAFIFGDDIRPDADATMKTLKRRGLRLGMVSGDGEATTRRAAELLGAAAGLRGAVTRGDPDVVRTEDDVRTRLSAEAYDKAFEQGRSLRSAAVSER